MEAALDMRDKLGRRLSQKRVERRIKIMAVTLRLVASRGYDGASVSELAAECGVSKKTLYDIYGSKEGVVAAAVSSRMHDVTRRIETVPRGRSLESLLKIIRMTVDAVLEFPTLSRALAPLLVRDAAAFNITHFFDRLHRVALSEMAEDGLLQPWVDLDFTLRSLMFEQLAVQNMWAGENIPTRQYEGFALMSACRLLVPLTTPAVQPELVNQIRRLQNDLSFIW